MTEEEHEHWEQIALDNYMEERGYSLSFLYPAVPFDELPTLGEWLDS